MACSRRRGGTGGRATSCHWIREMPPEACGSDRRDGSLRRRRATSQLSDRTGRHSSRGLHAHPAPAITARPLRRLRRSCGGADLGPVFAHLTPLDDFDGRPPWGNRECCAGGQEGEKPGPPPKMDDVIEIARRGGGRAENDNEDGDPKDGTDLATHLDDGAAGGGLIRLKPGSTGGDESRNHQTDADADDEPSRQNGGSVVGMGAEAEADEYCPNTHQ